MTQAAADPTAPLTGWQVLIPRPVGRADELADLLRRRGAQPRPVPLIGVTPMTQSPEMRDAVQHLAGGDFDWVALTSAAAVTALRLAADGIGRTLSVGGDTRVAVVGAATARAARDAGLPVDLVPPTPGSGAALAAAWPAEAPGTTVLLPRSDRASRELPDALRATGHRVMEVCAYRTEPAPVPDPDRAALRDGGIDAVLLTSPSTAQALVAIGEPTAVALREAGLGVDAVAAEPSAEGLVAALERAAAADAGGHRRTAAS
jgi:uroporphyrinogen-III synthase/uroporphyrinogen III methyltransferase/synthase